MDDKNISNFPRKPVKINYDKNLRFQAIDWIECDETVDTSLNSFEYFEKAIKLVMRQRKLLMETGSSRSIVFEASLKNNTDLKSFG